MTSYEKVYGRFLSKIATDEYQKLPDDVFRDILYETLESAISKMEMECVEMKHDYFKRDDDLKEFDEDLSGGEIEVIALYMVITWYEPKINSLECTTLWVGASGDKWDDSKKHLEAMISSSKHARLEAKRMIQRYHLSNNSYIKR